MTEELIKAATATFHAAGHKPKSISAVLEQIKADHGIEATVSGGLLSLKQGSTTFDLGTVVSAIAEKHPRLFYGGAGTVNFKSDLADDPQAKVRYIKEHGLPAWDALPLNEKSPNANKVVTDQIPNSEMTSQEYMRLSLSEKSDLAGRIGAVGIQKIMARKRK